MISDDFKSIFKVIFMARKTENLWPFLEKRQLYIFDGKKKTMYRVFYPRSPDKALIRFELYKSEVWCLLLDRVAL